jgi:hypothetical protein
LLGFIVSHRGIEANPEKIEAILRMEAPRSQKKVQRLTGCMAALSRFISRLGGSGSSRRTEEIPDNTTSAETATPSHAESTD